jgi:poly(3-hydroxybutyrate) depolymerase/lysophospholipase L1-like esterase
MKYILIIATILLFVGLPFAQIKIACIGSSITEGVNTTSGHAYPAQLQQMLGSGYTVKNEGASGTFILRNAGYPYWITAQFADLFAFKPNIITIKHGANDAAPTTWNTLGQNYKRDYLAFIDTLNKISTHPKIYILIEIPNFEHNGKDTCLAKILAIEKQVAVERGLPLIDTHTPLLPFPQYYPDGLHPNDAAHDTLAHVIYRYLTSTNPADKFIFRKHPYRISTVTDSLPYRLFYPYLYDRQTKYPLILTLHGVGESGIDNKLQVQGRGVCVWAEDSTQTKQKCFVVSPQCPTSDKWVNVPAWSDMFYSTTTLQMSNSLQGALSLVDSMVREFPIDTNRLYVTGLSMGGYGSWDLIARYPKKFAAAVPMSGGCDTGKAEAIKNMSMWTFHGDRDPTVPPVATTAMITSLRNKGMPVVQYTAQYANYFANATISRTNLTNKIDSLNKIIYGEYTDGVHDIWTKSYNDPLLARWLFLQDKSKKPPVSIVRQEVRNISQHSVGQYLMHGQESFDFLSMRLAAGTSYKVTVFNLIGAVKAVSIVNNRSEARVFVRGQLHANSGTEIIRLSIISKQVSN